MNIGIPKERRPAEFRVGLTPPGVSLLAPAGHTCFVERGAGLGAGFSDEQYAEAGARIVYSPDEAWGRAQLVLKVSCPLDSELAMAPSGQVVMSIFALAGAHEGKLAVLKERGLTAIAYEEIRLEDGSFPVVKPLSQIGGRMAAQVVARLLQNNFGGKGILLGGVPGVPPAEVVILGAGVVGENAARSLAGSGAHVTLIDRDLARLQEVETCLPGRVVTLVAHAFNLEKACAYADAVVGAVHVPGQRAPVVLKRDLLRKMKPGAVFVDLSIDHGGCAETSRPTTHDSPTYVAEGILHFCVPNLPGAVARTATHAFLNAAWPYIQAVATLGAERATAEDEALAGAVVTWKGEVRNARVVRHETK